MPLLLGLFVALCIVGISALVAAGVIAAAELTPADEDFAHTAIAVGALAGLYSLPGAMMSAAYHELVVRSAPWDQAALVRAFE